MLVVRKVEGAGTTTKQNISYVTAFPRALPYTSLEPNTALLFRLPYLNSIHVGTRNFNKDIIGLIPFS